VQAAASLSRLFPRAVGAAAPAAPVRGSAPACCPSLAPALTSPHAAFPCRPGPSHPSAPGAQGLQCAYVTNTPKAGSFEFRELAWSGHGVATVFVGSALERISGGLFKAARHRVVGTGTGMGTCQRGHEPRRMAATFFFRPEKNARLVPIPSPQVAVAPGYEAVPWSEWSARTARRYQRNKGKKKGATPP